MDEWMDRLLVARCTAMAMAVQEACEVASDRFGLGGPDQDDLEQEVWLALLTRWREADQWDYPQIDVPALARRIGRVLAACRFGGGLRDLDMVAVESTHQPTADLRIDLADLLARLSPDDEQFCRQWMAGSLPAAHPAFPRVLIFDSAYLLALRPVFEAAGLRVYL